MTTSTAPSTSAAAENGGLSKAELRRQKILAKRGARMALVAGDRTLGESATNKIAAASAASAASATTAAAAESRPATRNEEPSARLEGAVPPPPVVDDWASFFPPGAAGNQDVVPDRRGFVLCVPTSARIVLLVLCAVLVPVLRATELVPRASALQMFLAAEAVVLAPALVARSAARPAGGGIFRVFSMAATAAGVLRTVYADIALFLLALFCALRLAELFS